MVIKINTGTYRFPIKIQERPGYLYILSIMARIITNGEHYTISLNSYYGIMHIIGIYKSQS